MKKLILGLIVGAIIGLWFGINIGRDEPLFSNPLTERSIQERLVDSGGELIEKGGKLVKE